MSLLRTFNKMVDKRLISPPKWMASNFHYLVYSGSRSYGCQQDESDVDVTGWCIPPKHVVFPHMAGVIQGFGSQGEKFESWQEHHCKDPDGGGKQYDFGVYNIVHYFKLLMDNNPDKLDTLFVPEFCISHITETGRLVRDNRRMFLHKGAWFRFRGYSAAQFKKMQSKEFTNEKRKADVEDYGFSCFHEETEFLTIDGWKAFDEINPGMELGTLNLDSDKFEWQTPSAGLKKRYSGKMYTVDSYMNKCCVTSDHNMLVSKCSRSKTNNFSIEYNKSKANWSLKSIKDLLDGNSSYYHIKRALPIISEDNLNYSIEELVLFGLFISEGTINFRKNKDETKVKSLRIFQTPNGKEEVFDFMRRLTKKDSTIKEYTYAHPAREGEEAREVTIWVFNAKHPITQKCYNLFGHHSLKKRLPLREFNLSYKQARMFWCGLCLGDGTLTNNGDCYYTANKNLADDIQAMMTLSGHTCSIRGPFTSLSNMTNKECASYQVYLSLEEKECNAVPFRLKSEVKRRDGNQIKETEVNDANVVCFDVKNSTLVTRYKNKISIQGNCKFAAHLVRLLLEGEQILVEGDLDPLRNKEILKAIRRGEWTLEQVTKWMEEKLLQLEKAYSESKIPDRPDEAKIKALLVNCLESHYGSLSNAVYLPGRFEDAIRDIQKIVGNL